MNPALPKDAECRIPGTAGIDLIGTWLYAPSDPNRLIGIHLHHPYDEIQAGRWPDCTGGGYIAWAEAPGTTPKHQLIRGGPENLEDLTVTPSLWHRARGRDGENSPHHGCHGFITDGRWVPV